MSVFLIISLLVCLLTGIYLLQPFGSITPETVRPNLPESFIWPVLILAAAAMLYVKVGDANAISRQIQSSDDVAGQLQTTRSDPSNIRAWNDLGRTYLLEQNYVHAYMAYTEAEQLDTSSTRNDIGERLKWITGLAEARILAQQGAVDSVSHELIERALALDPEHPKVLWYGGLAAAQKNDFTNAKIRWEKLLKLAPPEALQAVVRTRLEAIDNLQNQAEVAHWALNFNIRLDDQLLKGQTPASRVYASLRQADDQPPLAAHAYQINELIDTLELNSNDVISGMGGRRELNWDAPVFLTLIWSPSGQAIADNNVKLTAEVRHEDLNTITQFTIRPANE